MARTTTKRIVRIFSTALAVLMSMMMLFTVTAFATEIPDATSNFYVNDFANIIDDDTEREMQERAVALADSSDGVQVVVTTVQTIGDADPVQYTVDMYNKYEIGKNSMGVIIMLSVETRDIQIRTGDNMTKYLSASAINNILEADGYPYLGNDEFSKGLEEIQNSIIKHIEKKITKDTVQNEVAVVPENETAEDVKSEGLFGAIMASLAVIGGGIASFFGIDKYTKKRKAEKAAEKKAKIENSEIGKLKSAKIDALESKIRALQGMASRLIDGLKRECNNHFASQEQKIASLSDKIRNNRTYIKGFEDRRKRAVKAYPDLEEKVDAALKGMTMPVPNQETVTRGAELLEDDEKVKEVFDAKRKSLLGEIADEVNSAIKDMNKLPELPVQQNVSSEELSGFDKMIAEHEAKKMAKENEMILSSEFIQKKTNRITFLMNRLSNGINNDAAVSAEQVIQSFESRRTSNNAKIRTLTAELAASDAEVAAIGMRQAKSLEIYPDLEEKTNEVYRQEKIAADKAEAAIVEKHVRGLIAEVCSRLNLWKYENALESYNGLTSDQKQYIPGEIIQKLKKMCAEAQEEQRKWEAAERIRKNKERAASVQSMMMSAMHYTVTRHHLDELNRACNAYDNLTMEQRQYVSADINRLKMLQRDAQRQQREYEEAERRRREEEDRRRRRRQEEEARRRRQQSSYRSSSFGGSRSHGGFGGRSSGRGGGGKF